MLTVFSCCLIYSSSSSCSSSFFSSFPESRYGGLKTSLPFYPSFSSSSSTALSFSFKEASLMNLSLLSFTKNCFTSGWAFYRRCSRTLSTEREKPTGIFCTCCARVICTTLTGSLSRSMPIDFAKCFLNISGSPWYAAVPMCKYI